MLSGLAAGASLCWLLSPPKERVMGGGRKEVFLWGHGALAVKGGPWDAGGAVPPHLAFCFTARDARTEPGQEDAEPASECG